MRVKFFSSKAIQIVSVIIGVISSIVFLYDRFVLNNQADLVFDVLTNTEIFSFNEDLDSLKVFYGDENLVSAKTNIHIITVNIRNQGKADIRSEDIYKDYFGFKVQNGKIIGTPKLINFSNSVFKEHLNITTVDSSEIKFDAIPVNAGDGFTLKLFTLTSENLNPSIEPLGYISGLGRIELQKTYSQKEEVGILDSENFKKFTIGIGVLFLSYLLVGLAFLSHNFVVSFRRALEVDAYMRQRKTKLTDNAKRLHLLYSTNTDFDVLEIRRIWDNKKLILEVVHFLYEFELDTNKKTSSNYKELKNYKNGIRIGSNFSFFKDLIRDGVIKKKGNEVSFAAEFFDELEDFTNFLIQNKKILNNS